MSRLAQLKSDVQDLRLAPYGKRESTFLKNLQHRTIIRQDFSDQLPDPKEKVDLRLREAASYLNEPCRWLRAQWRRVRARAATASSLDTSLIVADANKQRPIPGAEWSEERSRNRSTSL
jgi:hypothetical protein